MSCVLVSRIPRLCSQGRTLPTTARTVESRGRCLGRWRRVYVGGESIVFDVVELCRRWFLSGTVSVPLFTRVMHRGVFRTWTLGTCYPSPMHHGASKSRTDLCGPSSVERPSHAAQPRSHPLALGDDDVDFLSSTMVAWARSGSRPGVPTSLSSFGQLGRLDYYVLYSEH